MKKNKSHLLQTTIMVIVIIWFAMIVAVRVYQNRGSSPPPSPWGSAPELSDVEKQQLLQDLVSKEKNTFTKSEKAEIIQEVDQNKLNNFTVEEKMEIVQQLAK